MRSMWLVVLRGASGFVEQPQRYAVERTFAWLGRYRRQSRDYERFEGSSEAMIKISRFIACSGC